MKFFRKRINEIKKFFSNWRLEKTALLIAIGSGLAFLLYFIIPFPSGYLSPTDVSTRIYDRNYELLMELTPEDEGLYEPLELSEVPEKFTELLIFSEDKEFYRHIGFSPLAILRAFWENLRANEIVSGGSTLSQQLAKMK